MKEKESVEDLLGIKREVSRLRSEVRSVKENKRESFKSINPYTSAITGNFWTQNAMPWVSESTRKAVITEYYWQPIRGQPRRRRLCRA